MVDPEKRPHGFMSPEKMREIFEEISDLKKKIEEYIQWRKDLFQRSQQDISLDEVEGAIADRSEIWTTPNVIDND